MNTVAIYPGTFDPITNGHRDLVERALHLFDKVIVAIAHNPGKQPAFDITTRERLAKTVLADLKNAEVKSFDNLLIDFAKAQHATAILRGLRAVMDFDYEFQMAGMNRHLAPEIETVFLTPSATHAYISSTFVREIAMLQGDISLFVHPCVIEAFTQLR